MFLSLNGADPKKTFSSMGFRPFLRPVWFGSGAGGGVPVMGTLVMGEAVKAGSTSREE